MTLARAERRDLQPTLQPLDLAEQLRERVALLAALVQRLQAAEQGFAALPVNEDLADVPAPITVTS